MAVVYMAIGYLLRKYPIRQAEIPRWLINGGMYLVGSLFAYSIPAMLGFIPEKSAVAIGTGLFSDSAFLVQLLAYALVLDFLVYWLHRGFHASPMLWRVHLSHHTDTDLDFTDSFRFHPFEKMFDIPLVFLSVTIVGASLEVVLTYVFFYTTFLFFPHSNVRVHPRLEKLLGAIIVTPRMHSLHHSTNRIYTNSNYGDLFSFWDKLFSTYQQMDEDVRKDMEYGLEYFRSSGEQRFTSVLLQPFWYQPELHKPDSNQR